MTEGLEGMLSAIGVFRSFLVLAFQMEESKQNTWME
jgi:hypothetical protein